MISAAFTVNGASNPAAHSVTYGSTVNLELLSYVGATSIIWEILSCSDTDEILPTITITGTPPGRTASFVMPSDSSDGYGRTFLVRCTVSTQIVGSGGVTQQSVEYAVVGAANVRDILPIAPGEENYRHGTHGWGPEINIALKNTSSGTGLTVSGTPSTGNIIKYNGTTAVWTSDSTYTINSFSASTSSVEVGSTATTPSFTASHTGTPTSLLLTNNDNGESKSVSGTPTSFTSSQNYTKSTVNASVTFTLTGSDGFSNSSRTTTINWRQKIFWGISTSPANTEAFVEGLANNELNSSFSKTFTVNATSTNKIYFAHRTSAGTPTFTVGGFSGGFTLRSSTISVTNANGFTENYSLWESDTAGLGSTTVTVS